MKDIDNSYSRALDEALEMTFPASDPIAISPNQSEITEEDSNR
jgi:hypothetical protein